jgi:Mce-associated membrane protein
VIGRPLSAVAVPVRKVWRFGAGHRRVMLIAWTVVVLALAGVAGGLWWQHSQHQATQDAGQAALDAARKNAVQVLSYNFRTVDDDLAHARTALTGKFQDDFTQLASGVVAPAAKQDQIDTRAEVAGSGVVSMTQDQVVTLLFVNQTTRSTKLTAPKIDGSRLQLTMQRVGGQWLISDLKPL